MGMYNPPHPGEIIRQFCIEPLGLTVNEVAKAVGVTRKTLSALLNGRSGISPIFQVCIRPPLIPDDMFTFNFYVSTFGGFFFIAAGGIISQLGKNRSMRR